MNTEEKTLPPDPDGQNEDRAEWAAEALLMFMSVTGTDQEDAVADLLCDLMHWCDRNGETGFVSELERARMHYGYETGAITEGEGVSNA